MTRSTIEIIVVGILLLIIAGLVDAFFHEKHKQTVTVVDYFQELKIKDVKELHLVSCSSLERIDIHKKDNPKKNIEASFYVPVQVDACTNLQNVTFVKGKDSILAKVIMPHCYYGPVNMMINESNMVQYKKRFVFLGSEDDAKLWSEMKEQAASTQTEIIHMADSTHLLHRADSAEVAYMDSLLTVAGHRNIPVVLADTIKK